MLSSDLESRMIQIIEKLDKLEIKEKRPTAKNVPIETEKYEYLIQKNVKKRMSQVTAKVTNFLAQLNGDEKENDKLKETALTKPSMALNMKRLITVGEFQIELQKLLEILEFSLNDENKENKNYLEKYVNDISLVSDDNSNSIDDSAKIKKFGDTLEKKYHKISLLLKRYLKENSILNGIIEKEKKNNGEKKKHTESKRRRRSLFDRVPLFFGSNDKNIQQMPNFGNTLLSEMKDDIEKKQKRYSYANIGKIEEEKVDDVENVSGSENSVDEDDNEDENDEKLIYRPGRLRSSLCVDDLFAC